MLIFFLLNIPCDRPAKEGEKDGIKSDGSRFIIPTTTDVMYVDFFLVPVLRYLFLTQLLNIIFSSYYLKWYALMIHFTNLP